MRTILLALAIFAVGCGASSSDDASGGSAGASATGGSSSGGTSSNGGSAGGGAVGGSSGDSGTGAAAGSGGAAGTPGGGGDAGSAGSAGSSADYPGQPPDGMLVWGASIQSNGDPVARHETPSGHVLTLHRTFFQWTQRTGKMIDTAKDDIAHKRLPWVSIKTPSWADMGKGAHDSEIDEMLGALDAIQGPVWLTMHHEPEGGGGVNSPDDPAGPAGHIAMNERVRQRMTALGVDNVALAPILMSWTFDPASKRDPNEWWKPGIYDFLGVDHYRDSETSLLNPTWSTIRKWAEQKGVEVAVGEWGMRGTDAAAGDRVHEWYDSAAGSNVDGAGARVMGLSAFDSGANSPTGSWELKGAQLTAFWDLLNDPRTATVVP